MTHREAILSRVLAERIRQLSLPGSEWDARHGPNDWLAIAGSYCLSTASRMHQPVTREQFEEEIIKAMAVLLAALEHVPGMVERKLLTSKTDP